jgi:hypothetical protein
MDSNEEVEKRVGVDNRTGQRSEVVSKRSRRVASKSRVSTSTVTIIVVLVVIVAATIVYVVNRNANRLADLASATAPPTIVPQPVPAPTPVIIQQAAPMQPATIVIQQPAQPSIEKELTSASDANLLDLASKKLNEDLELGGVVTTVNDARAVLTGAVGSEAAKAKAEQLVKAIQGMKAVHNKIVVAG